MSDEKKIDDMKDPVKEDSDQVKEKERDVTTETTNPPETGEESSETVVQDSKKNKKDKNSTKRVVFSYIRIIAIAAAAAIFLMTVVFTNVKVPTGSMKDTINEGDRLIGLRLAYVAAEPQRGDIVIFKYPDDESTKFVKRVIGLPGETVSLKNGDVYINGELLEEDYIREPHSTQAINETEYTVPENSFFMLGDNRNNSKDARWWKNTYVTKDKIVAKVLFRYFDGEKGGIGFSGF